MKPELCDPGFLGAKKFGGFLADPGWIYDQFTGVENGAACAVMETRGLKDICQIRAGHRWAANPCVMFMWGTGPKNDCAVFVERAWGFTHKTMFPWLKTAPSRKQINENAPLLMAGGIGIWAEGKCEYMHCSTRGDVGGFYTVGPKNPETGKRTFTRLRPRPPNVLVGPRECPVFWDERIESDPDYWNSLTAQMILAPGAKGGRKGSETNHSKKPLALYDYIETFPGDLLELYARRKPVCALPEERRKRWTCIGWDHGHELGPWGVRPRPVETTGLF